MSKEQSVLVFNLQCQVATQQAGQGTHGNSALRNTAMRQRQRIGMADGTFVNDKLISWDIMGKLDDDAPVDIVTLSYTYLLLKLIPLVNGTN